MVTTPLEFSGRGFRHYDRFDGETNDFGYDTP